MAAQFAPMLTDTWVEILLVPWSRSVQAYNIVGHIALNWHLFSVEWSVWERESLVRSNHG